MNNQPPPYIPPEIQELIDLGKAGKLWAIEIPYDNGQGETKIIRQWNMRGEQVMKLRQKIFQYGLTVPVRPHEWLIVPPMDIRHCLLIQQNAYLPEKPFGYDAGETKS